MKKFTRHFITLTLLLFVFNSFGQFTTAWNTPYRHTASTGYSNEGRKIAEDASGNIFVMADVTSDIDPLGIQGTTTWHYVTLTKYSTNGAKLSTLDINVKNHIVSGYNNYSAFGLEVDASGNVYVAYCMYSGSTSFDVGLDKYNNNLVPVWQNLYTLNGTGGGVEMKLHPSGTIYAVVHSDYLLSSYYTLIKSVPSNSMAQLVYGFAANGPFINSLALDGAQKAYVTGYTTKSGFKNIYVASINVSSNTLVWSSSYTTPSIAGNDVGNQITVGSDGGVYTVGTSDVGGAAGEQAIVLKNLPANPRFQFVSLLRAAPDTKGLFINASESGWVYVGATSSTTATVFRIPNNGIFSTPGKVEYTPVPNTTFTAVTNITMNAMEISTSKNIYITGGVIADGPGGSFTSSYLIKTAVVFGNALIRAGDIGVEGTFSHNYEGFDINLDYAKTDVYWLRNYWDNTHQNESIELIDVSVPSPLRHTIPGGTNMISMFPNPASDKVTITSDADITSVEVLNMTGKQVLFTSSVSKEVILNTSSLSKGVYFCKVKTEEGEQVERLVIN